MAHVGIQRLRARRGQKHAAEDHKAEFIIRAHEKLHRVRGVERPEHLRHGENVHRPPVAPRKRNHTSITGPKALPMRLVPACCTAKSDAMMQSVMMMTPV